jgi:hypothetical protein
MSRHMPYKHYRREQHSPTEPPKMSADMSVDTVIKLLSDTQLKYRRLHFDDYARELAPRPATVSNRIQLPSFLRSLFDEGANINVESVSGKKYSFWHSFLYCTYPPYIAQSWYRRKELVDQFTDELNHDVQSYFQKDPIIRETNMDPIDVRFHSMLPSDQLVYYLSSKFRMNIVICDTTRIYYYFPGISFCKEDPTIILLRDDSPTFHVVQIDDRKITVGHDRHDSLVMDNLYQNVPEVNRVLKEHIPKPKCMATGTDIPKAKFIPKIRTQTISTPKTVSETETRSYEQKIDMYTKVNKETPEGTFRMESKPKLNAMRLTELQELAKKYDVSTEKQGKSKMVKKLKKELVDDIMEHLWSK